MCTNHAVPDAKHPSKNAPIYSLGICKFITSKSWITKLANVGENRQNDKKRLVPSYLNVIG